MICTLCTLYLPTYRSTITTEFMCIYPCTVHTDAQTDIYTHYRRSPVCDGQFVITKSEYHNAGIRIMTVTLTRTQQTNKTSAKKCLIPFTCGWNNPESTNLIQTNRFAGTESKKSWYDFHFSIPLKQPAVAGRPVCVEPTEVHSFHLPIARK